jgi:eukaryotic-like serine/threonine-protein kinase
VRVTGPAAAAPPVRLGHFELGRRLRDGANTVVYEAHDTMLGRRVALQVAHDPGDLGEGDGRDRLLREAQAVARLEHPNVLTVFEVGRSPDGIFAATEWTDGGTLETWLGAHRTWREIVAMFVAAGHGLAALHGIERVHLGFKPSSVWLDRAGTPKISGLDQADGPALDGALELRTGGRGDAGTDQFMFAAALVEALTGRLPEDGGLAALPARLGPVLGRAVARDPARRYPAMTALLTELARQGRRRAGGWRIAAGAVVLAGMVMAALLVVRNRAAVLPDPCPAPDAQAAALWPTRRAAVRTRIIATDPAQGAARFAAAARVIEPIVDAWRAMSVASCQATRVRHAQPDRVFDLRQRCLQRRAHELDASVEAMTASTSASALDAAVAGLIQITPIDACGDAAVLARTDEAPVDPRVRIDADELTRRIDGIEVDLRADRLVGLLARAEATVARARSLGHPRTLAAALAVLARVELGIDESRRATVTLRELTQVAATAHDDPDEAYAWTKLIRVIGFDQQQLEEALALLPVASAAVLRAGDPVELRVELLYSEAIVLEQGPRVADALQRLERARRILEGDGAARSGSHLASRLADIVHEMGNAYSVAGDQGAAIASYRRVLTDRRALYGPDSVDEAIALHNLGEALRLAGRLDDALVAVSEAARINEARMGESSRLASNLVSIATILGDQGDWEKSLAVHDRALGIYRTRLLHDDVQLAAVLVGRALALSHTRRAGDARAAADEVIAMLERAGATTLNLPIAYYNRGELAVRLGRCDEALADYARALDGFVAQLGRSAGFLVYPLVGQGRCLVRTGRAAAAIAPLERAVGLPTEASAALQAALARAWLGRALVESGRDRPRGRALARAARAGVAQAATTDPDGSAALDDLDRWLSAR